MNHAFCLTKHSLRKKTDIDARAELPTTYVTEVVTPCPASTPSPTPVPASPKQATVPPPPKDAAVNRQQEVRLALDTAIVVVGWPNIYLDPAQRTRLWNQCAVTGAARSAIPSTHPAAAEAVPGTTRGGRYIKSLVSVRLFISLFQCQLCHQLVPRKKKD